MVAFPLFFAHVAIYILNRSPMEHSLLAVWQAQWLPLVTRWVRYTLGTMYPGHLVDRIQEGVRLSLGRDPIKTSQECETALTSQF